MKNNCIVDDERFHINSCPQISFIKVLDVFSGSTYRADLLIRNHIQVEKTTNLVSSYDKLPAVEHILIVHPYFYFSSFDSFHDAFLVCSFVPFQIAKNISNCANFVENVPTKFYTCRLSTKQLQFASLTTDHYKVTAMFDREDGTYSCRIDLLTSLAEVMAVVKSNDITFELEVSCWSMNVWR